MKTVLPTLTLAAILWLSAALPSGASPRTWTNNDGQTMEAELVDVSGDHVHFRRDGRVYRYPVASLSAADQAEVRKRAEASPQSPGRDSTTPALGQELTGKLVQMQGGRLRPLGEADLQQTRLVAFYYSAAWCGPCRQFTPDLVRAYTRLKRAHPDFELVFVSADRDERSMADYMKDYRMTFPAFRFDQRQSVPFVQQLSPRGIPHLVMVDGTGNVVAGGRGGAAASLEAIEAFLASRPRT
jgi:thiol-disulfide isomerase/thioredoxin